MQRRTLFRLGLGGAIVLGVGGAGVATWRPGWLDGRLTAPGRAIFEAVGRAVLDGSLPADPSTSESQLAAHLDRVEAAIAAFPPPVQQELSQLLALLAGPAGRLAMTGLWRDWPDASVAELQAALQRMRSSSFDLRQQAYHALRDLTNGAFYADPTAWPLLGYPGPLAL